MDANGDIVGQHAVASLHPGTLAEVVRAMIRTFGDDIAPGDAYITNHPYLAGTPHSIDMAVVTPFFHDGRLVAFSGRTRAQERSRRPRFGDRERAGLRTVPARASSTTPIRLVRRGEWRGDIERILRANSRTPDLIMGDIRGQLGVARLGERRLAETIAKHGVDALLEVFARMHDSAETQLRQAIATWPDGTDRGRVDRRHRRDRPRTLDPLSRQADEDRRPVALRPHRLQRSSPGADQHPADAGPRGAVPLRARGVRRHPSADRRRRGASSRRRSGPARSCARTISVRVGDVHGVVHGARGSDAAGAQPARPHQAPRAQRRDRRQRLRRPARRRLDVHPIRVDRLERTAARSARTARRGSRRCSRTRRPRRSRSSKASTRRACAASS